MEDVSLNTLIYYGIIYVVFVLSATVHEAAHAWSAWRLGDGTARDLGRMTLNPLAHIDLMGTVIFPLLNLFMIMQGGMGFLIGWMKPVPVQYGNLDNPRRDILLVSLAGPFSNLLLAAVGCMLCWIFILTGLLDPQLTAAVYLYKLLFYFVLINLVLAAFNLLPIPPLDGSSIVDYIRKDAYGTYHSKGGIGIIILYVGILLGFFRYLWVGATAAMAFLIYNLWAPVVMLAIFCGILVLFVLKTVPGGIPRARYRGPMDRPQVMTRKGLKIGKILEQVRKTAESAARGEALTPRERELYEKLKSDPGDGQPLCSSISFDVRNEFCQTCRNLGRCIIRDGEEKGKN